MTDAGTGVTEATDGDEAAAPAGDPVREGLVERLTAALGDDKVVGSLVDKGDVCVRVDRSAWRAAAQFLKEHGFSYFCFLSAIDWMPSAELSTRYEQVYQPAEGAAGAEAEEGAAGAMTTGTAGGDTRFQVFMRLYDTRRKLGITLKTDVGDRSPAVESIVAVFRGADWHERETWEMFGIDFPGHPGLRHLYLPSQFEGFPLRKDFPLLSRVVKPWPGLVDKEPVPGEDEEEEAAP